VRVVFDFNASASDSAPFESIQFAIKWSINVIVCFQKENYLLFRQPSLSSEKDQRNIIERSEKDQRNIRENSESSTASLEKSKKSHFIVNYSELHLYWKM
jgi:hypothetical protein